MAGDSMARVEDYQIVSNNNHHRVTKEVKDLIAQDWQMWGEMSVVVTPASNTPIFSQAMVKYNALWPDS